MPNLTLESLLDMLGSEANVAAVQMHVQAALQRAQDREAQDLHDRRTYEQLLQRPPSPWRGTKTPFAEIMWIDAETWPEYRLFDSLVLNDDSPEEFEKKSLPVGPFLYANRTLPAGLPLPVAGPNGRRGKVFFDDHITVPVLYDGKADLGGEYRYRTWMGVTPFEILTQGPGLEMAKGRVVIAGLGLGWFLSEVAKKPEVTEIIVVEQSVALLIAIKQKLKDQYPAIAAKVVKWVDADAYEFVGQWNDGDEAMFLFDIWPTYGEVDYDKKFLSLEQRFGEGRIWGWGRHSTESNRSKIRKNPCSECPFSRTCDSTTSIGGADPLGLIGQASSRFFLPCHQETDYYAIRHTDRLFSLAQCAGAAIYRSNAGYTGLPEALHMLPEDTTKVYATPAELLAGYGQMPMAAAELILAATPVSELRRLEFEKMGQTEDEQGD
jgi:hypothetical protein